MAACERLLGRLRVFAARRDAEDLERVNSALRRKRMEPRSLNAGSTQTCRADAIGVSRDNSVGARGMENGPAIAQIAGEFASKPAEIERCKRGLLRENRHLIKSESDISSDNQFSESYISILNSITYKIDVAEEEGFEPPRPLRALRFSRPPPSTTRPFLRPQSD